MEELAENLEAKVRKWLGKQGYPMEMQVAQAFINKAFYVIQADVFEDEETGKFREIDVMASKFSYVDSGEQVSAIFRIACIVECKASNGRPWVLFSPQTDKFNFDSGSILATETASDFLKKLGKDTNLQNYVERIMTNKLFSESPTGYGIVQTLREAKSNVDVTYQAFQSAIKASVSKIKQAQKISGPDIYLEVIAVPIVVVDTPLYKSRLDQNNEITLEEIDFGAVRWNQFQLPGFSQTYIFVVKLQAFFRFITLITELVDTLAQTFNENKSIIGPMLQNRSGNNPTPAS
jgi:hypothetical protein